MIRTRISGWRSAAVLLGGTVLLASGPAGALTLDWDLVTWATAGTRTQTYTVGSGDVIVTVTEPASPTRTPAPKGRVLRVLN